MLKEALVKLLKVKSLVTIALTATFCALAFLGVVTGEQVNSVFLMVASFFFGTQAEKLNRKDDTQ